MAEGTPAQPSFSEQASQIVAAYVAHNSVPIADLPGFIRSVHDVLTSLSQPPVAEAPAEPLKPAVSIKRSVTDDYIISLEDGRKFKSMKRYLAGLGMTPAEYRAKWGLPPDYPMVAPAYAKVRSEQAKKIGLGNLRKRPAEVAPELASAPQPKAAAPKRGRARKAA